MILSLFALLAVPLALAFATQRFAPVVAARIRKPLETVALTTLLVFIVLAVIGQWTNFVAELTRTLPVVVAHNALGLACGYLPSLLLGLNPADRRAVTIEGGMQNSGLALGLIALQFNGDLAMVAVAGLWGIWHIVSGGTLALIWRRTQ